MCLTYTTVHLSDMGKIEMYHQQCKERYLLGKPVCKLLGKPGLYWFDVLDSRSYKYVPLTLYVKLILSKKWTLYITSSVRPIWQLACERQSLLGSLVLPVLICSLSFYCHIRACPSAYNLKTLNVHNRYRMYSDIYWYTYIMDHIKKVSLQKGSTTKGIGTKGIATKSIEKKGIGNKRYRQQKVSIFGP